VFVPQKTVYNLHFEDESLSELEVKVNACSVEEFNQIVADSVLVGQEALEAANGLIALFVSNLVSWNISLDGENLLPKTVDSIKKLDQPLVVRLISSWQAAMMTIPNPSNRKSSSGGISEELSLGLANGSVSQPSWPQ